VVTLGEGDDGIGAQAPITRATSSRASRGVLTSV